MNSLPRLMLIFFLLCPGFIFCQAPYNGIEGGLGNIFRLSDAKSRSISAENTRGEKGKGGMAGDGQPAGTPGALGQGWKGSPCVTIKSKTIYTVAEINGQGSIQHIWMTPTGNWRYSILRFYWDDETEPSVEVPVGDFFCMGWGKYAPVQSLAVCVNPGSAFNCYWPMPFRRKCRITMENTADQDMTLFYQVDYIETKVPADAAYFHAQYRRVNPVPFKENYVLVDSIRGKGQYVGTYMAYGSYRNGWWGEGEIKFYMDGDTKFPTICGTGTEDYFCGSYNFETRQKTAAGIELAKYTEFTNPYSGLAQVIPGDGLYNVSQRFGLYRWHIADPIRFDQDLKVTIQDLGWKNGHLYPLKDDISTVVFWYQIDPHHPFPKLPSRDELEID